MGTGVHRLQLNLLMRGLSLMKDGGRLVYSTCSMNPVRSSLVRRGKYVVMSTWWEACSQKV